MREREWLTGTDPGGMLMLTGEGTTDRKLRLFACACCRLAWNRFVPPVAVGVVAAAEAFADGKASAEELGRVHGIATAAADAAQVAPASGYGYIVHVLRAAAHASRAQGWTAADEAHRAAARAGADVPVSGLSREPAVRAAYRAELAVQAELLRDIFGNPFRKVQFDPAWRTADVLALARQVYESRDFGAMPILADALQDAGCGEEEVLSHCREDREHVRGCWVVDLLLRKS